MGGGRWSWVPDLGAVGGAIMGWIGEKGGGKQAVGMYEGGGRENRRLRAVRWAVDSGVGRRAWELWEA